MKKADFMVIIVSLIKCFPHENLPCNREITQMLKFILNNITKLKKKTKNFFQKLNEIYIMLVINAIMKIKAKKGNT